MGTYEYPKKLVDQLTEWEADGSEIIITQGFNSTIFIVKHPGIDKWLMVIECYPGSDSEYCHVNITGKALHRVHKMIHEFID